MTPGAEEQVLETNGKRMTGDVVVGPIPQNYGLVEWNGAYIRIS